MIASLRQHLIGALRIDEEVAQSLLWEAPRSLLLEAVPTLVRRLFRRWRLAFPGSSGLLDLHEPFHPLPDFVPRNLFSDLSLPEVRVLVPPATVNHDWRSEAMPILDALRQLVPGRVTRRFAFERGGLSHWVPVDPSLPIQNCRIRDYAEEYEFVGEFAGRFNDAVDDAPRLVFRPWTVRLAKATRTEALPSSNAHLSWRTDIIANGEPLSVPVAPRSPWRPYVASVDFFLHRFRGSASVRRFAPNASANVRTLQDEFPVEVHFRSDDNRPAAIGFELEVDGFRLDLMLPPADQISARLLDPRSLGDCKLSYLRDRFRSDDLLPDDLNVFQRDWLFQILCAAIGAEAAASGRAIADIASGLLDDAGISAKFQDVMDHYFGHVPPDTAEEDSEEEDEEGGNPVIPPNAHAASRLQQALAGQVARPEVRERLRALAGEFETPDPASFDHWLRRLILETLGKAMLQACVAVAPRQASLDDLLVDIRDDPDGATTIWITETTLGGAGALQAFAERFANEPRIFFDAVEATLAPTDLEMVDLGLRRVLTLACDDPEIRQAMVRLRSTESHAVSVRLWRELSRTLAQRGGVDLSHALVVALNSRLLRPGSGPALDQILAGLATYWDELERQFGLAIGLREFAYIASRNDYWRERVRTYLAVTLPVGGAATVSVFAALFSMLWPREGEVRRMGLQSYHPYREARATDPAVVRELMLARTVRSVELSAPNWRQQLDSAFADEGACRLIAEVAMARELRTSLVMLAAMPIDVGALQFFPAVERIERVGGQVFVELVLREHA